MSWECQLCFLPDPYNGAGDGIGSCECLRCDCCGAGPFECDCEKDWEPGWDDEDDVYDALCNDTACPNRRRRLAAANPTRAALNDYVRAEELRRRADEVTP